MGNKKASGERTNLFKQAVDAVPDLKDGYCAGLHALGANAKMIMAADARKIDGSVDIDKCTRESYPNDARWDYALGYEEKAYFLEIHPAKTSEVKKMLKKAEWLGKWLSHKAPALKAMAIGNVFYWVASGEHDILPNSRQYKELAQSSIWLVSRFRLPMKMK